VGTARGGGVHSGVAKSETATWAPHFDATVTAMEIWEPPGSVQLLEGWAIWRYRRSHDHGQSEIARKTSRGGAPIGRESVDKARRFSLLEHPQSRTAYPVRLGSTGLPCARAAWAAAVV